MKKTKLLLLMLLALTGWGKVAADTVSPYNVDFEKAINTSDHAFAVASNWLHIVPVSDYDGYGPYYMSYSYSQDKGINDSHALIVNRQYAGDNWGGETIKDVLVTPIISGEVKMYVKVGTLASTSQPSFVEFYKVDETGTTLGQSIQTFTENNYAESDVEGWSTVTINVSTPQRIGIRAQHVIIDNFSATSADIEKEKKLTIASAEPSATTGTIYWNQLENGNVLIKYTVTVTNTGEVPFAVNDENYSISIINRRTKEALVTVNIPQALAPGETSAKFDVSVEVPTTLWPNSYTYISMDLQENISNSVLQRAQSRYNVYEPKFVFRAEGSTSTSSLYGDIAFGKVTEQTSKTYEIYNDGTAPLEIVSITVPEGFTVNNSGNFTLASKEFQTFTITMTDVIGIYSGNLEVKYKNLDGTETTYTKAITGTVLDPSKNIITFDDGAGNNLFPQGSVLYDAFITSEGSGDAKNSYLRNGSGSNPLYITPLMTAEAGENFAFDAKDAGSGCKVEVMISTDRQNWTTIQTVSNIASNWTTYTAQISEAGDYYIGFKLTNAMIDNIYGLVYATAPAHDLLLVKSDIPKTGKQNSDYTATISVGNVGPNVETAGTYTATLYVNGEAVATSNDVDLPVADLSGNRKNTEESNYTTLSFTFKPHLVGTYPAYIEVKSGEAVVATDKVEVTFAEETMESELAIESDGSESNTPLNLNYNNSESVSLYTSTVLTDKFGLEDGDKIGSIVYKAYKTGDDHQTLLSVYYKWVDDTELAAPTSNGLYDTEGMTAYKVNELHTWEKKGAYDDLVDYYTIDFDEPLVYEKGKSLLIVMRSLNQLPGSNYKTVNWEKSKIAQNPDKAGTYLNYCHYTDNVSDDQRDPETNYVTSFSANWYSKNLPAIHINLIKEPTSLSGVVTSTRDESPVEGATVTLYNEENDVEYTGTTDEEGKFNIGVIQDKLTYTVTVEANGYTTLNAKEPVSFPEGSISKDYQLDPTSIEITISKYGYSTFYYSNSAYAIPEGVTAHVVESVSGKSLSLIEVMDVIPAGCGVLLEGEADKKYTFEQAEDPGTSYENMLLGTDETVTIEAQPDYKYYILSSKNNVVGFYYGAEDGGSFENKANHAYLAVPVTTSNGINAFFFDNATGIEAVSTNGDYINGPAYNLSGQRVNKNYKGVVIVNGKKILKK